jgi:enterobacteria phage integrase
MTSMRKLPPHVECWRDRHEKLRTYFRRGKGRRIPLPDVGAEGFDAAYIEAMAGEVAVQRVQRAADAPGTIGALVTSYLTSAVYVALRATTKTGYGWRLEWLRTEHGQRTVSGLNRSRVIGILQPLADRPGQALVTLRILRILIRHAIDKGWLNHDPSLGIKRPKTQEVRSWTDGEIAQFEARWPIGTRERLAFALMLFTGQRRSDVHRMTWADITDDTIRVVQQKTGAKLAIPLHQDLVSVLAAASRQHVTIINTQYDKPFRVTAFGSWFRDAITAAGLPMDCKPHGLRKAAGRRLAEAGCTGKEIMSVLGHKTLAQAELYTRDADQAHLAAAAVIKLEDRRGTGTPKPTKLGLGKFEKG